MFPWEGEGEGAPEAPFAGSFLTPPWFHQGWTLANETLSWDSES